MYPTRSHLREIEYSINQQAAFIVDNLGDPGDDLRDSPVVVGAAYNLGRYLADIQMAMTGGNQVKESAFNLGHKTLIYGTGLVPRLIDNFFYGKLPQ